MSLSISDPEWVSRFVDANGLLIPPPLNGGVPDQRVRFADIVEFLRVFPAQVDQYGSPHGEFLTINGGSADQRALLPTERDEPLYRYEFTGELPALWEVEVGTTAPIFGCPGGALYVVVYGANGVKMNVFELCDAGVLREARA